MLKGQSGPHTNKLEYARPHGTGRGGPPRLTYKPNWETGCWEWLLPPTPQGYGRHQWDGYRDVAHRIFYQQLVGPIPKGMHIDHLCRNRKCVNPQHLEVVTCAENLRRGVGPTRARQRSIRTTPEQRDAAVAAVRRGESRKEWAKRLGVSEGNIRTWARHR